MAVKKTFLHLPPQQVLLPVKIYPFSHVLEKALETKKITPESMIPLISAARPAKRPG